MSDEGIDCYDWVGCPGTCDECDIWFRVLPWHQVAWLRARRLALRAWRRFTTPIWRWRVTRASRSTEGER